MTDNINGIHKEIEASGQKLQTVTNFKCLGAIVSDAGSKADILSRVVQCTAAMTDKIASAKKIVKGTQYQGNKKKRKAKEKMGR